MPNAKLMVQNINANAKMKLIQENIVKNVKYILNVFRKILFNLKLKLLNNLKLDDTCWNNKCQNGSECIPFNSGYECKCQNDGYSGKYCENCKIYFKRISPKKMFS